MQTTLPLLPTDWSQEHNELIMKICRRAAAWWREQLMVPAEVAKYSGGTKIAALIEVQAAQAAPGIKLSQLESFEAELGAALYKAVVSRWTVKIAVLCIGTEYAPDELLAVAARNHDISTTHFPFKTLMWIYTRPGEARLLVEGSPREGRQELALAA